MTDDPNIALMTGIHAKLGATIAAACKMSSAQPDFLAALIANESGGDSNAKRFERGVLDSLWSVLQGRTANFGSIGRADLVRYILPTPGDLSQPTDLFAYISGHVTAAMQRMDGLATSWGVTQIMGYEGIALGFETSVLQDPTSALHYTCRMLADFAHRFDLDMGKDYWELFACWNTGRPHAQTTDLNYCPNGMARAQIYKHLLDESVIGDS
jgi:hypothetical protein